MGIVLVFLSAIGISHAQDKVEAKKLYIPAKVWLVPEHNNYDSKESDYSYSRMMETDNIAMF
ncbi:hypothetical protein [Flavobacterium flavigenum]|uniref:hypothetical protein n=1 Tax=Flavobacterium flavigenum TaxID=3003258 RepID=UPI0024830C1B|nr:hypothetical protein [Flavobacterium flavigenum]